MKKTLDKKVRLWNFQAGDLVLKRILPPNNIDARGKWAPNYEGPYIMKNLFSGSALILDTMDGEEFPRPMKADAVKKHFA